MTAEPAIGILSGLGRAADLAQRRARFRLISSPLNPWGVPVLRTGDFTGKRVIVIGPAETVPEDLRGVEVDAYDVIVRLNNGIALATDNPGLLGSRTDVLFHNLHETGERSAGEIPVALLRSHGVRTCVFPHWGFKGSKRRLYAKRRQLRSAPDITLKVPPGRFCETLRRELGGMQPTVGTSAIAFFLACDLRELAVHGFTFFETPYLAGYNCAVRTAADASAWAKSSQVHEPGRDKQLIRHRAALAERRGLRLSLGANVQKHLGG